MNIHIMGKSVNKINGCVIVCGSPQFLQMENDAVREQTMEIEGLFQANLQGLRERNIQCEDLKGALSRLQ